MEVKIEGLEEIGKRLQLLNQHLKRRAGTRVVKLALAPMAKAAIVSTPVKSGRLLRGWSLFVTYDEKGQALGYVRNRHYTALWVEKGHKVVRVSKRKQGWRTIRTKHVVGYVRGKNILKSAFDANADKAITIAAQQMSIEIDKAVGAFGK